MTRDSRGGHNRKRVDENFFKTWSPSMAYVLGLICADGAVEDVRKSSRTCYLQLSSIDRSLLSQVKLCISSSHKLYIYDPKPMNIKGKTYLRSKIYVLRIGNKVIFQDLVSLGVIPRKSLRLQLPPVPDEYFGFFIRGYFDGDGCVNVYSQKKIKRIQTIFTSGCKSFLDKLSYKLSGIVGITGKIAFNSGAFRLGYKGKRSLNLLSFMYSHLNSAPFLKRKHKTYTKYLSLVS